MRWAKLWKGLLIGLAVLLALFAFVVVIAPSPQLPFDTPAGARLSYVRVNDGVCTTSWMLSCSQAVVDRAAGESLVGWTRSAEMGGLESIVYTRADEEVTIVGWNFGSDDRPATHVLYDSPASALDYVDSIVSRARSWL